VYIGALQECDDDDDEVIGGPQWSWVGWGWTDARLHVEFTVWNTWVYQKVYFSLNRLIAGWVVSWKWVLYAFSACRCNRNTAAAAHEPLWQHIQAVLWQDVDWSVHWCQAWI